ncbi:MAG: Crp/Fnr family transcriptional regulator, partial [Limisphaerales bacterium]
MNIHHSVLENETRSSNEKSGSATREGPRLDLRRLKWASGLSPETLNAIMDEAEWVDFQPGDVLIDVDAEITHMYFLITGRVQAILYDTLGKEIEKDTIVPGFAIGLIALGARDQSQLCAEAIEPSRAIRFAVPELLDLASKHPDFQRVLFEMAVNAFKRYMTADRSLPKPAIVGIVHHTEASRPLAGRLARRLRDLDERPCIAGDDEHWKSDG